MKIRSRLVAGLAALLLVPAALGSGALFYLLHRSLSTTIEVAEASVGVSDVLHLQVLTLTAAMPPNDYLIHGDAVERAAFARLSRELDEAFERALTGSRVPREEQDIVRAAREEWRRAEAIARALLALPRPVGDPAAARDMERMAAHAERAVDLLDRARRRFDDVAGRAVIEARGFERETIGFAAGIFGVASAIAVAIALWLARSILVPLQKLEGTAVRFGSGDLTYRAVPLADDELGRFAETFNTMADALAHDRATLDAHVARLGALNRVAVDLNSPLRLHEILDNIMRRGIDLTSATAACIAFYDETAGCFTDWTTQGLSERFVQNMSFRTGGLADEVFAAGAYALSNDRPDTRHKLSKLAHEEGIRSFVCLPLTSRDHRLGVIYFYRADRDMFTPGEIELLTTFAALAAGAIENARLYAQAQVQARTDALTDLDNRREFRRRFDEEIERARRHDHSVSLLMIDIDYFKKVNDAYGHLAGDGILHAVAARIRAEIRPTDRAARYGGEEFTVILPETPVDGARVVAERVRRAVADVPFRLGDGREIGLTVSIGASCCPDDAGDSQEVVERADQALYTAKEAGRNRVVLYHQTLKAEIEKDPARIVPLLNENPANLDPLLTAVSSKAAFFRGHTDAVERAAARLAAALALPEEDAAALALAARLHDLGMAAVPDAVLRKTTALEPGEWAQIRRHPAIAAGWLEQVPALAHLAPIVRHHHERWDGGGYPDGLKGEATPFLARVLAVADAYGVVITDWPGHKAMAPAKAEAALRAGAGTQFDPRIVQALLGAPG